MLLPYLFKVSVILAALTLGYRWLIQYETFSRVNRTLLWLNVLAAWGLPLLPLASWGPVEIQREFHQTLPELTRVVPEIPQTIATPIFTIAAHRPNQLGMNFDPVWNASNWLLIIYFLGVLVVGGRFLFQLALLLRTLRRKQKHQLGNGLILIEDKSTPSPYSFFRWIVFNPGLHTEGELQQILAHETEHARQGHSFDLLMAEMQRIALWFNPFAWVHQKLVQSNLEYLADQGVLANGFAKKTYQIALLNATIRTSESPLTNSFAQSLLKKRIKMMNRKPSRRLAWGKYILLLAALYVSAAFVAPYQKQIVDMTPAPLQPVVSAIVTENPTLEGKPLKKVEVAEPEEILSVKNEKVKTTSADSVKDTKSKWIVMKGDTLYWALASTATWEDISLMKEIIKNSGVEMTLNRLNYDPTQSFITAFEVRMQTIGFGGGGTGTDIEDEYTPIKGYSGYIINGGRGMGQTPPEPLRSRRNQSYQEALALKKANKNEYLADKLMKEIYKKSGGIGGTTYPKKYFESMSSEKGFNKDGLSKSQENKLTLGEINRNAEFYLNAEPSTFEELNGVSINEIDKVEVKESSSPTKRYFMVYTN